MLTASPAPTRQGPGFSRFEVVIAGGGVAALETALALREMAGHRVALTLVSPSTDFVLPPLAVGAPFAVAHVPSWPLADIAGDGAPALVVVVAGAHAARARSPTAHASGRREWWVNAMSDSSGGITASLARA